MIDKISSIVYQLTSNIVCKINVNLYKQVKNEMRNDYSEFEYWNDKHNDYVNSIRLNFRYYLSLESVYYDNDGSKGFIMIDYTGLAILSQMFEIANKWFIEKDYNGLFMIKDNILSVNPLVLTDDMILSETIRETKIEIKPAAVTINYTQYAGVSITFAGTQFSLTYEQFIGFKYFLDRCDMYLMAQSLVNYMINCPNIGTNVVKMNPVPQTEVKHGIVGNGVNGILGRTIGKQNEDGTFDEL